MKVCVSCQNKLFPETKEKKEFCPKCGRGLAFCPKCKKCDTTILPNDNYCLGCGLPRGQALIAPLYPTDEPFILF